VANGKGIKQLEAPSPLNPELKLCFFFKDANEQRVVR
jgi:hypothetical protein